jgi:hypothetical protein
MRAFSSVFILSIFDDVQPKTERLYMSNAIALVNGTTDVVLSHKTGKTGSFARAMAFASREVRQQIGASMYLTWLQNGTYRPIVNDILGCGLVAKSAVPYVAGMIPENGAIKKEQLINLCLAVDNAVRKSGKEIKGQKAFVYGVVNRIVEESKIDAGEGEVVAQA